MAKTYDPTMGSQEIQWLKRKATARSEKAL